MSVTHAWVGAATHQGFTVVAKVSGGSAQLWYATNIELNDPVITAAQVPVLGIVRFTITGLVPNQQYHWAVDDTGTLSTTWQGKVRTHPTPGAPASFRFAASSCAGLDTTPDTPGQVITSAVSNHPVFDRIRESDPLLTVHLGDLHYRNIDTDTVADFLAAYDDVLTYNGTLGGTARQGRLYRSNSIAYIPDDHDYGSNNSDKNSASRAAANQAYRLRVPSYELPDDEGMYQAWVIGRVLFILSDTRTFRDPNSLPQSPGKSMLGAQQKEWMQQVLTSTDAEFFVWLLPTPWTGNGSDKWDGFTHERAELAAMFTSTGWANRMVSLTGDRHALALDTGATNPYGGFAQYMVGSLDSAGTDEDPQYDMGMSAGNNRWGSFNVVDSGEQISFTGTLMIGNTVWKSHTVTIQLDTDPGPDPDPEPPPIGDARSSSDVTYLACDVVTGAVFDELPDLTGGFGKLLGAYTTASMTTPILTSGPGTRRNILASSDVGQVMIVPVVNGLPTWGGIITTREGGSEPVLRLGMSSIEGYLVRRYVNEPLGPYRGVDDCSVIARTFLRQAGPWLGVGGGIDMIIDAPPSGILRNWDVTLPTDHKTIYECMTALMAVGPEWTIDLAWGDERQSSVAKIARVRPRIGTASTRPTAVFEQSTPSAYGSAGPEISYTYKEDFTDGRGANVIIAYSSGQDDSQPTSQPAIDPSLLLGRPAFEKHYQPDTSTTDTTRLDAHAQAELARISRGALTWDLTARSNATPRLNVDWRLGDDVAWTVAGPRHPEGVSAIGRVIGWDLDPQAGLVKLILWEGES